MMDRGQSLSTHDQRQIEHHQHQTYDSQPSPNPRSHLSRSISYPATTQAQYTAQIHDPNSSHRKDEQNVTYAGLGISIPSSADNSQSQTHLVPSPESPFTTHMRYTTGQPPTPSFPTLRSSSPASSIWSASDPGTSNNLSGFIPRLHKMVSDEKYQGLISWNSSGTSFYISRVTEFAATVLPLHFKHNNFSSFVRQLNMYGFHKVNKTPRGYKIASENQVWEFSHTKFIRHRPDLLDEIKRRQGDVDFIREGDLSTHMSLMQMQQNDLMKQLNTLQEQVTTLVNGFNETQNRQSSQEDRIKMVLEYLEKQPQHSPSSSQSSVAHTVQRKPSMQKTPGRRPSHVSRLVLDESDRRYSVSTPQELETYFEGDLSLSNLETPPQSSPPASQPSSSGSNHRSPTTTKTLRAAATFSTPSQVSTPSTQYTPASSFSSMSSIQRTQTAHSNTSPSLHRNKSMVMSNPSPNVTPSPAYNYTQYAPTLTTIDSGGQIMSQDLNTRPHSSHAGPSMQQPQPPATYQSAAAPYATPPRISTMHQQQYTNQQFQTPIRQDPYVSDQLQLTSPASFTPSNPMHTLAQQIHQQQRRRRQDSDVTEDMDLA